MQRENRATIRRNLKITSGWLLLVCLVALPVNAQYYQDAYPGPQNPYWSGDWAAPQQGWDQRSQSGHPRHSQVPPPQNLQYDQRDAESILRDQVARTQGQYAEPQQAAQAQPQIYDDFSIPTLNDEHQVGRVMNLARKISRMIQKRNGKAFIVMDKRNFQFYLYGRNGKLLRIGPVAIGKGTTRVGAFETPVGVFPIRQKIAVDDWIRPDWYFIEEGEPIPKRWEDRRVPGFFRYKLVFDGTRYIHYAEATGGRLTHGCLGLDWQDAEAVFHTLSVGSYCIIIDGPFLARLAKGEFPIRTAAKPRKPASTEKESSKESEKTETSVVSQSEGQQDRAFRSLW